VAPGFEVTDLLRPGMQFKQVCLEACAALLPDEVVTSAQLEGELAVVYDRFGLYVGRLELMTGIRERRFFPAGTLPSRVSAETVHRLLDRSGFPREAVGCLVHGSVCRDRLEPATACAVHRRCGLPEACLAFDLSNACLGLLNGAVLAAQLIESGRIDAAIVVGTEDGRTLVESTIAALRENPHVTRRDLKLAFASLTIGSASAAWLLCHERRSRTGRRLLGGAWLIDSSHHELCEGGPAGGDAVLMQTDSEALLEAGIGLADRTFPRFLDAIAWTRTTMTRTITHQVGRAHRRQLYDRLGIDPALDFSTVETLGNTGAAALPATLALAMERQAVRSGDQVGLLGIGSGLNCLMLGVAEPET